MGGDGADGGAVDKRGAGRGRGGDGGFIEHDAAPVDRFGCGLRRAGREREGLGRRIAAPDVEAVTQLAGPDALHARRAAAILHLVETQAEAGRQVHRLASLEREAALGERRSWGGAGGEGGANDGKQQVAHRSEWSCR